MMRACARTQRAQTQAGAPEHTTTQYAQGMLYTHTPSSICGKLHCTFHVQQLS